MKKVIFSIAALAFSWMPLLAPAADAPAPADQAAPADTASQADLEKQLEDARAKLQEYARKVADLSMQLNGSSFYYSAGSDSATRHGVLGVDLDGVDYQDTNQVGVTISGVTRGGPADKAGLKEGDVLTAINNTSLKSSGDESPGVKLMRYMKGVKPGDSMSIAYTRDGKSAIAKLVAGDAGDLFAVRMPGFSHRPVLGIDIGHDDSGNGVAVVAVTPDGPADKAGLHTGDVILALNGTSLKPDDDRSSGDQLLAFMDREHPGDKVKVDYTRDGKAGSATVTVASSGDYSFSFRMPPIPPMPPILPMPPMPRIYPHWGAFGGGRWGEMQLTPMNAGLAAYFGTDKGLLVLKASKDSPLQVQDGDVIVSIGGRMLDTPSQAMRILASYGPGETVKLDVMRKGKPVTLNVALPKSRADSEDNTFSQVLPAWDVDDDN